MVILNKYNETEIWDIFPEYFHFFKSLKLANTSFKLYVLKKWFHNEKQPTKADLQKNIILVKNKHFENGDNEAWLIHEIAHIIFYNLKGNFFNKPYPTNIEEDFAFSFQFLFLKSKGLTYEEVSTYLMQAYAKEEYLNYHPIFIDYYNKTSKNKIKRLCT
jgi:hypothetical protein